MKKTYDKKNLDNFRLLMLTLMEASSEKFTRIFVKFRGLSSQGNVCL